MAINLHEKDCGKIVDAYTHESYLAGRAKSEYDFTGHKTIRLYNIITQELNDYDLNAGDGSSRFGPLKELQDTYQELTMGENKAFNIAVDKTYNSDQQMMKKAGHIMGEQIKERFVPYCDKHILKKWAQGAGHTVELAVTAASVTGKHLITALLGIETHYNNTHVDVNDRYVAVKYSDIALIRDADRWSNVEQQTDKYLVKGVFDAFGTLKVFGMPDDWFPNGVRAVAFQSKAVLSPMKIKTARIITDSENIDGDIIQGHFYFDAFVIGRRCDGVVTIVDKGFKLATPKITVGDSTTTIAQGDSADIYYTTDGSDPRYSATRTKYTAAFNNADEVIAVATYAAEQDKYCSDIDKA